MTVPEQRVFLAPPTTSRRRVLTGLAATAAAGLGMPAFAQGKPIRIGTTFDNSSVEKANGQGLFQGSSAFFNALNKSGGLNGTKVELVMADDTFKPDVAKANALAFEKDSSVLALLHPLGTRQTSEVMDAVPGMAVVGPITGTVALRKKTAPNTFWVRVNYDQEVEKLVTTAAVLGQSRIGLVHSNDPLGQSVLAAFKAALAKAKLEPAVIATTPNTTSMEVGPAAEAIAKAKPQVIIIGLAGTAPVFMKALRDAGGNSSAYGLSITASALAAMGDLARGLGFVIVVPSPYSTKFEIVRRYQADMVANGTKDFSLTSLEGYINAAVLAEGLRRAGGSPTRASVMAGLASIENFDLGGLKINYGRTNREGGHFVDVAVIGSRGQMLS
ncbi:ABC-type branched-subunit amino acid transport system substrate-binding protein [Variovorax boronicumulans]|uniref:ABC-type branched-subunit amino acid transport system substrate-binding protein n=1 Tax=Variovorax boronicumulans TaxID=436515 RepID=A0AAW8D8B8_9BURK|nr:MULTISPECIES: ABC transporter substrate-binding protein [Variovorax]MDP9897257.1 ABC-type branched-subunit amino acid transport system substrate-binding protein [Variovorax boronicumulans]MDQ0038816.1 ABC-type branched-subunit amino acid transport system substrate-binding protein [Variovorax boronicumulans]MDQ0057298.1 ABC-type branched-subunit amino acid transport system substrate-binding protein [Variovorax boronicumulans]MDQ0611718.1 branched-chain amino acid transport system substrate-bi